MRARDGAGYRIRGDAELVLDGHTADVVLAAANTDAGISLFAVAADADGLDSRTAGHPRPHAQGRPSPVRRRARPVDRNRRRRGCGTGARRPTSRIVALAAEQVGAAQRCLDMAVGYAKERIQFGRAIGSFQAVKHRCADMLVLVEGARSAAVHAAEVAGERRAAGRGLGGEDGLLGGIPAGRIWTTCASTVASGSPGNTMHTCTFGAPRPPN